MGRFVVTIEWAILYFFALSLVAALAHAPQKDSPPQSWFDMALFLTFAIGMALIVWQGAQGHLPGTGVAVKGMFPFLARFLAWSGGLALLLGAAGGLTGYLIDRPAWADVRQGMGIVVLLPTFVGGAAGFLIGAVVAIVKTVRQG
jgi:hypothetical protein